MNTTHNWHNLSHYGLRGHDQHRREMRQRRLMERLGNALILFLAVLALIAAWPAHAEPTNAPDTKGHFVLVVGGTATAKWDSLSVISQGTTQYRIQPFTVTGFTSFHQCRSAGMELQARLNSDGYVLDFSCIATGK